MEGKGGSGSMSIAERLDALTAEAVAVHARLECVVERQNKARHFDIADHYRMVAFLHRKAAINVETVRLLATMPAEMPSK